MESRGINLRRLGMALGVLLAVSAVFALMVIRKPSPQVITLASGYRLEFAGADYGTNTEPPTWLPRLVEHLPTRLAQLVRNHAPGRLAQFGGAGWTYDRPQLLVWFRVLGNGTPGASPTLQFSPKVADQDGVECGDWTRYGNGSDWFYVAFPVAPRRSREIQCVLYPASGGTNPVGRVSFRNPLFGRFPQWQPDSVPAMKMASDLEVRLDDLAIQDGLGSVSLAKAKHRSAGQRGGQGQKVFTSFQLSLDPANGATEAWELHHAELDDATGNVLRLSALPIPGWGIGDSRLSQQSGKTTFTYAIPGTLWPDETAWRLKLEVGRALGFDPSEIVTFTNVPVPAPGTNTSFRLTNSVGGVQVVLTGFERQRHNMQLGDTTVFVSNDVLIELHGKLTGMALDVQNVTSDDGIRMSGNLFGSGSAYALDMPQIPANATNLNISLVVQKTRSVEFYVKPPSGGTN